MALIRLGALGSVVTLRLADRWGRQPVLLISVLVFTVLTGATAAATGLVVFVVLQVLARVFLSTEETLASVVFTKELRPEHRSAGIGMLGILSTAGFGLVALLLLAVDSTPLGWRLFYVVALIPLAVVVFLRRHLEETRAFRLAAAPERVRQLRLPQLPPEQARHPRWLLVALTAVGMLEPPPSSSRPSWPRTTTAGRACSPSSSSRRRRPPCSATSSAAVIVVAGSAGLLVTGVLAPVVDPTVTVLALAGLAAASVLALRGVPETAGTDVLAPVPTQEVT